MRATLSVRVGHVGLAGFTQVAAAIR